MNEFSRRQLVAAGVIVIIALIGTVLLVIKSGSSGSSGEMKFIEAGEAAQIINTEVTEVTPPKPEKLVVHVAGKVKSPGVYELGPGSRVRDAIHAAGGAFSNADLDTINLAEKLTDGQQVFIAAKGAVPPPLVSGVKGGAPSSSQNSSPSSSSSKKANKPSEPEKLQTPGQGTVNINTAGLNELQRLPGIGPATAQSILEYRSQHGRFQSVDELDEVSGIGPAKLAKLRPFISL